MTEQLYKYFLVEKDGRETEHKFTFDNQDHIDSLLISEISRGCKVVKYKIDCVISRVSVDKTQ